MAREFLCVPEPAVREKIQSADLGRPHAWRRGTDRFIYDAGSDVQDTAGWSRDALLWNLIALVERLTDSSG